MLRLGFNICHVMYREDIAGSKGLSAVDSATELSGCCARSYNLVGFTRMEVRMFTPADSK